MFVKKKGELIVKVSFEGIGQKVATFEVETKLEVGKVVSMAENGIVRLAKENEKFVGVVVESAGKIASVQFAGFAKLKFSGEVPQAALGWAQVCTNADGGVKLNADGRPVLLLEIDRENNQLGLML